MKLRLRRLNVRYFIAVALGTAVAGIGFFSSFSNLSRWAELHFFTPGIVLPLGLDLAIPALLLLDSLRPSLFLRSTAWCITAGTVAANWAVTPGDDPWARALHAVLPAISAVFFEAARRHVLPDDGALMDRIRWARYLVAPIRTARIRSRMVAWETTSYREALAREAVVLYARTVLIAWHGKKTWRSTRKHVPLALLHQLAEGDIPTSVLHAMDRPTAVRAWILQAVQDMANLRQSTTAARPVICHHGGPILPHRPTARPTGALAGREGDRADLSALLNGLHHPIVYLATHGDRVALGSTQNLRRALADHWLRPTDVALALHGGPALERSIGARFADEHLTGRWYALSGELAAWISRGGVDEPPAPTAASESAPEPLAVEVAPPAAPPPPAAERTTRRPSRGRYMDEWIEVAKPYVKELIIELRKRPSGDDLAAALADAEIEDPPAVSTARKICAAVLNKHPEYLTPILASHTLDEPTEPDEQSAQPAIATA
ncbi:uncharacterized protein DUF2637 [Actinocorallia herbida]|uniref:Uncharacterized protein DUF2637 n=1 Tax=Actinocorallia herbida TaxID=58109 RepID=A0A3N1CMK1_9ACTN|nr:DUF2637 domain-containing protein [Actinocorallia herbida]ROO82541.1 uncharacterized protein DUF2637 [Actinocorallia herbida]